MVEGVQQGPVLVGTPTKPSSSTSSWSGGVLKMVPGPLFKSFLL